MIQSILVPKAKFGLPDAVEWVRRHGFHSHKVDITGNFYRFRQMEPMHGGYYRTKTLPNKIEIVSHYYK